jgi:hypothetical protein
MYCISTHDFGSQYQKNIGTSPKICTISTATSNKFKKEKKEYNEWLSFADFKNRLDLTEKGGFIDNLCQ